MAGRQQGSHYKLTWSGDHDEHGLMHGAGSLREEHYSNTSHCAFNHGVMYGCRLDTYDYGVKVLHLSNAQYQWAPWMKIDAVSGKMILTGTSTTSTDWISEKEVNTFTPSYQAFLREWKAGMRDHGFGELSDFEWIHPDPDRFNRIKPAIQRSCTLGEEEEENAEATGAQ